MCRLTTRKRTRNDLKKMYQERKKDEREMVCLVPGRRRWIMKIKNDLLSILEKRRKNNQRLVKHDTKKKKKKKKQKEKLTVSDIIKRVKHIHIYIYIYI